MNSNCLFKIQVILVPLLFLCNITFAEDAWHDFLREFQEGYLHGDFREEIKPPSGGQEAIYRYYFSNGQLAAEILPKKGDIKIYDEKGKLYKEGNMVKGILRGYDKNGELYSETHFNNYQIHGITKTYQDGRLVLESPYKKGKLQGIERYFDKDGMLLSKTHYQNGVVVKELHYQKGILRVELINFKDHRREEKIYHP
ncbi:MAG: hypothetical protein HYU97_02430 [Deltaproteobacteria bacterium]|nr:hypothetical protein [Deltaproteobacteria bacterium]